MSFSNRMARVKVQGGVAYRRSLVPLVKTRDFGMTPPKNVPLFAITFPARDLGDRSGSVRRDQSRTRSEGQVGRGAKEWRTQRATQAAFQRHRCNRRDGPCKASLRRRNNREP